ncbi:MAG: substrate-binding domain-containing protein [Chloroflexota bacterium]
MPQTLLHLGRVLFLLLLLVGCNRSSVQESMQDDGLELSGGTSVIERGEDGKTRSTSIDLFDDSDDFEVGTVYRVAEVAEEDRITSPVQVQEFDVKLPDIDPLEVEGDITIAGSSTVFPLAQLLYTRIIEHGYAGNVAIQELGTSGGFSRFCGGDELDIVTASRRIQHDEIELCAAKGRIPIELQIGVDALTIVVSRDNQVTNNISLDELATIFTADNWSDVNAEWPEELIEHIVPSDSTGTFEFFMQEVLGGDMAGLLSTANVRQERNYDILAQEVSQAPNGIGFFGHVFYQRHISTLKPVAVDDIRPEQDALAQNQYPLVRPIFLYTDLGTLVQKPQVMAFLIFFLNRVNLEMGALGYFPASHKVLNNSRWTLSEVISGEIIGAGSSTVYPLAHKMATEFVDALGFKGGITIDQGGSGEGFRLFCEEGVIDFATASRIIREEESAACAKRGIAPIPLSIGTDALAIVVNPSNSFLTDVTFEELAGIFTATLWSEVNAEWPEEPILHYVPEESSGTYDFFVQEIFKGDADQIRAAPNTTTVPSQEWLARAIQSEPHAIGFLGYAFYQQSADVMKILSVNGIEASPMTVEGNEYPLARPLLIYSDINTISKRPQVTAFLNYVLTHVNQEIEQVGYFPASDDVLTASKRRLYETMTLNVIAHWFSVKWEELARDEQRLWQILGWNQASWDEEASPPITALQLWHELTVRQRTAAQRLGFNREIWDVLAR